MGDEHSGTDNGEPRREGRLLTERYRLGEELGRGGMGTVWRARDEMLGRTVAVKELRFPSDVDEEEKRRLITRTLREAKAIARIRSGGAVTVYDVVEEDDRPWIVMELVEGRSLAEVIRQDGPLAPRRAAEVGLAVLDVLRAAHREGILHRDVKPSNVLIAEEDGRAVLTDFGIAKVEGDPSITSTGMLVGAPSYIAPERARGRPPGPPSDLWSLGGLLYAAVEGRPPYDKGSALATLTAVMTEPLPPPRRAGALTEVITGLLRKDPEQRLDDAGARALLRRAAAEGEEKPVAVGAAGADAAAAKTAAPAERKSAAPRAVAREGRGRPAEGPVTDAERADAAGEARAGEAPGATARPGGEPTAGGPAEAVRPRLAALASRRAWLVGIAAAAVLAVLSTVLAVAFLDEDGEGGARKRAGVSADAEGGERGRAQGPGAPEGSDSAAPSASSGRDDGDRGGDDGDDDASEADGERLPEGYREVENQRFHFRIALPEGWRRIGTSGQDIGAIYGPDDGAYPKVQVDFTDQPGDDALAAWREQEPAVRGSSHGYSRVSMTEVDEWPDHDYPTVADWVFERREGSGAVQVRVVNRGFRVDEDHGYAIMITCRAADWDGARCRTLRETVHATFQPLD